MNIAVCDSDAEIAVEVRNLIADCIKSSVKVFSSDKELLSDKDVFDIYFLDIKGISGLEIAHKIREKEKIGDMKSVIVFITGYGEYMPEAFDVQAFHYLLKPIKVEKFFEVLKNAITEVKKRKYNEEVFIQLKIHRRLKNFDLQDILYLESNNKKVAFHTTEGIFEVLGKMEDFEQTLDNAFYRCHRCYIVNFSKIASYRQNEIELINGDKISVAYKKYSSFVKAYIAYAKTGGAVNV